MNKLPKLALLGLVGCLSLRPAVAQTVVALSGKSAVLGSAYDQNKQDFISQQCVTGTRVPTGSMESSIHLDQTMAKQQIEQSLGFSVGARARYGVADISGSAKFLSESGSSSYSVSAVYSAMYNFQTEKLVGVAENSLGTGLAPNFDRWQTTCGDSFVDEIHSGARLFFSIRIDFSSETQKQQFEANFSVSGPMAGVEGTLQQASKQFSGNTRVTISAYQVGGDVSKLTGIFGDKDTATQAYIQCTLGNFADCATVLANALVYATNTTTGFPAQITAHPAVISYGVTTYERAGIYTKPYPGLSDLIQLSREELSQQFEHTFANYLTASRLLAVTPVAFQKPRLQVLKDTLWDNLSQLRKASDVCYNTPNECPGAVHEKLQLKEADLTLLLSPSFEEVCDEAFRRPDGEPLRNTVETLLMLEGLDISIEGELVTPSYPRDCNGVAFAESMEQLDITPEALAKAKSDLAFKAHHTFLNLSSISDLTPLISMPKLAVLHADGQAITDLTPLSSLGTLEFISLNHNGVTDLRPLAGLTKMTLLSLGYNHIEDMAPLGVLKALGFLDISHNVISDIAAVSKLKQLTFLYAGFNQIADIRPIADLPELVRADFPHNTVKTLDGFQSILRLATLDLTANFIPKESIDKFCGGVHSSQLTFTDDGKAHYCPPRTTPVAQ